MITKMKIIKKIALGALCASSQFSFCVWPISFTTEEIASLEAAASKFRRLEFYHKLYSDLQSETSKLSEDQVYCFFKSFPTEKLTSNIVNLLLSKISGERQIAAFVGEIPLEYLTLDTVKLLHLDTNVELKEHVMQSGFSFARDEELCKLLNYPSISKEGMIAFAKENGENAFFSSEEVLRMAHHNEQIMKDVAFSLYGEWWGYRAPEPWASLWKDFIAAHPNYIR